MTENTPTIPIYFEWDILRPDKRMYKQQSIELKAMGLPVEVKVPLSHKYVANSDIIITQQMSKDDDVSLPILTPEGVAYVLEQFEQFLSDPEPEAFVEKESEDWEEGEEFEPETTKEEDFEDDFGEEDVDEKWDETEEWNE